MAYSVKREDVFLGRKLRFGETGNIALTRLMQKSQGHWQRPVHETWQGNSPRKQQLKGTLEHYPADNLAEFIDKLNHYTTLNAEYLKSQGITASFWQIAFYPLAKFIVNYFFKLGFLDGTHGFVHAMLMSLHSFLTRSKLWLLTRRRN